MSPYEILHISPLSKVWKHILITIQPKHIKAMNAIKILRFNNHPKWQKYTGEFKGKVTVQYLTHHQVHTTSLQCRHNEDNDVSNYQPQYCLLSGLFGHKSKKTSQLRVTDLCAGNSPVTGEFPAQRASNAENVSIWWCHHVLTILENYHKRKQSKWFDMYMYAIWFLWFLTLKYWFKSSQWEIA